MCLSECKVLEDLYKSQVAKCNMASYKAIYAESMTFEHGLLEPSDINFIDDGPASMLKV